MNKNTILFLGLVVVCIVVIAVMNIILNGQDADRQPLKVSPQRADKVEKVVVVPQETVTQGQGQPSFSTDEGEARPEYEATVSNGTILF